MKKHYLLFTAIFFCFTVKSQTTVLKKHFVTFDVAALIPITSYTFGYNYQLNNRFIVGVDYGLNTTESDGRENHNTNFRYREFKTDLKFILNPNGRNKHFFALEYHNLKHKEILRDGIYFGSINNTFEDTKWWYEEGNYLRNQTNLNFGYGIFIYFNKKNTFGIMPEFKLGIKFKKTELTNVYNAEKFDDLGEEEQKRFEKGIYSFDFLAPVYEHGGKNKRANIDISLKLFYNF